MFAALSLNEIAKLSRSIPISVIAGTLVLLWIPIYAFIALRRVYGGSRLVTLLKEIGLGVLYGIAAVPAIVAVAIVVARG